MGEALRKSLEEGPTFHVRTDPDTGQTVISGMGELHLEVLVDRMLREFRVQARVGKPQVAYRESITRPVEKAEYRYIKQTGGRGQYGHVVLELEPAELGEGLPSKMMYLAVQSEGIHQRHREGRARAAEAGVLAGFPVVDVHIRLYDGSYHEVDRAKWLSKWLPSGLQRGHSERQASSAGAGHEG
jgi:elongation factor G